MNENPLKSPLRCVDPDVRDRLWELGRPDLDPSVRRVLMAHLTVCDACREVVRLDERLGDLAREGRLPESSRTSRPPEHRIQWVRRAAALAVAASATAILALPPGPTAETRSTRGIGAARFLRPVEGEVVATGSPTLRWTPIEHASRYAVEIRDARGEVVWEGETVAPEVRVDGSARLEAGGEYRALLSVRPADLAPPVPASVAFRKGSLAEVALQRTHRASPWLQVLGVLSVGLLAATSLRSPWPAKGRRAA